MTVNLPSSKGLMIALSFKYLRVASAFTGMFQLFSASVSDKDIGSKIGIRHWCVLSCSLTCLYPFVKIES